MAAAGKPSSVLVISNCSAAKARRSPELPNFEALSDPYSRASWFTRLSASGLAARDMYTGQHHKSVIRSLDRWRLAWSDTRIDCVIVSAGLGVVEEHETIIPYESTFAGLPGTVAIDRAIQLDISMCLSRRLKAYDAAVFLLSAAYLAVLDPPLDLAGEEVYFAPDSYPVFGPRAIFIAAGRRTAYQLGVAPRLARAELFNRFVNAVTASSWSGAIAEAVNLTTNDIRPTALACSLFDEVLRS